LRDVQSLQAQVLEPEVLAKLEGVEEAMMPSLIGSPTPIASVGSKPKLCDEYVGIVNTGESRVSITFVQSPAGWEGVAQYGEYDEYRVVFKGTLRVEHDGGFIDVEAGQALHVKPLEWVRFSSPNEGGAEYINVCTPAFSRATIHRESSTAAH
jgi:mannose-6-phosphate isomerase-like protein (cupin superfamily)